MKKRFKGIPEGMTIGDYLIFENILVSSKELVAEFMERVRALAEDDTMLKEPAILYTPRYIGFGEFEALRHQDDNAKVFEFYAFPRFVGIPASAACSRILRDEAKAFEKLLHVAVVLGALEHNGLTDQRYLMLLQRINEFGVFVAGATQRLS